MRGMNGRQKQQQKKREELAKLLNALYDRPLYGKTRKERLERLTKLERIFDENLKKNKAAPRE